MPQYLIDIYFNVELLIGLNEMMYIIFSLLYFAFERKIGSIIRTKFEDPGIILTKHSVFKKAAMRASYKFRLKKFHDYLVYRFISIKHLKSERYQLIQNLIFIND